MNSIIEVEKEKIKELQYVIDELFTILFYREQIDDETKIDIEELRFEASDILDFLEVVDKAEIMPLIDKMINSTKEELPKIYYQLHILLELLETRADALAFSLLDLPEEEKLLDLPEEEKKEEIVLSDNNDINRAIDINNIINKIDVSSVNKIVDINNIINKIDVSSVNKIVS